MIKAGDKLGKMRMAIRSVQLEGYDKKNQDLPVDFKLIVSEKFADPTEKNGTFIFTKQKFMILDPKELQKGGRAKIQPG